MTTSKVAEILKYSELQMAAEAFFRTSNASPLEVDRDSLIRSLVAGNNHASKFTQTQAEYFAAHWRVVDQGASTNSGFSGTLFECVKDDPATGAKAGELVMSFRSTEFIDDAARDNQATNTLEIKDHGFAFGQIADMEDWYASLVREGKITDLNQLRVAGYSLGGGLASLVAAFFGETATTFDQGMGADTIHASSGNATNDSDWRGAA